MPDRVDFEASRDEVMNAHHRLSLSARALLTGDHDPPRRRGVPERKIALYCVNPIESASAQSGHAHSSRLTSAWVRHWSTIARAWGKCSVECATVEIELAEIESAVLGVRAGQPKLGSARRFLDAVVAQEKFGESRIQQLEGTAVS